MANKMTRVEELEQAIRDANDWLETYEGIDLLTGYADWMSPTSTHSYVVLKAILPKKDEVW